ncbi:MAG: hypothetical protein KDD38_02735 [Bdellovibrionales bacterium]|nr:hypothetical protein [Bdellovibrionales bacterium]
MKHIISLGLLFFTLTAQAQSQNQNWWSIDYIYNDFKYEEPGAMSEEGGLPGLRLELGMAFSSWLGLSIKGDYVSGNLTYDGATTGGTPVTTITKDRIWSYGSRLHFIADPLTFSVGWAKRYLYNNLVVSYRREQTYNYTPISVTYNSTPVYLTLEYRKFISGVNLTHKSDVDPARKDVTLNQDTGRGYSVEVGYNIPASPIQTRLSLQYSRWDIEQSDVQNDNVDDLVEPKNKTQELTFGIGLIF